MSKAKKKNTAKEIVTSTKESLLNSLKTLSRSKLLNFIENQSEVHIFEMEGARLKLVDAKQEADGWKVLAEKFKIERNEMRDEMVRQLHEKISIAATLDISTDKNVKKFADNLAQMENNLN